MAKAPARRVYRFGGGAAEGTAAMKDLLGGKGANLAEMSRLGLPVPPGFSITTEVCNSFFDNGQRYPDGLSGEVEEALPIYCRPGRRRLWRPPQPAAGFSAFRRPRLHAGHDGYRAQSRPQRRDRRRHRQAVPATAGLPSTVTGASSRCMPMWCSASIISFSRMCSTSTRSATAWRSIPSSRQKIGRC